MIEVKTAELIGPALDWAVAMAEGAKPERPQDGQVSFGGVHMLCGVRKHRLRGEYDYSPSTDWSQGGELIEKYAVKIEHFPSETIASKANARIAMRSSGYLQAQSGPTPLVALCRAIVAAKLGDAVSVPEELVQQPTEGRGGE